MKKYTIVIFFILFFPFLLKAQAPQGLNYQAVAYDGFGTAVINQGLGVRLSILDGSATGTLVYQEMQNPTTDNTGLFSIVIGNGTTVSGVFSNINWGNGSKWLKTEIDITGGTSYVVMGTSQFMSVPYALYANTAGVGSSSFLNPDGFNHVTTVVIPDSTSYTVPSGKNIYMPNAMGKLKIDNAVYHTYMTGFGGDYKNFIAASEGSVISSGAFSTICFLVDKMVEWKSIDLMNETFTVPAGKQFVITYSSFQWDSSTPTPLSPTCSINLNGILYPMFSLTLSNGILDEGMTISTSGCAPVPAGFNLALNGYLKDKN